MSLPERYKRAARRAIVRRGPLVTNAQLANYLHDFVKRYPSLCEQLRIGDQLDGDIDNIREAARRLVTTAPLGHKYEPSLVKGICKCGREYGDHVRKVQPQGDMGGGGAEQKP